MTPEPLEIKAKKARNALIDLAHHFLLLAYGKPSALEPDARERYYQDLGLLVSFAHFATHPDRRSTTESQG